MPLLQRRIFYKIFLIVINDSLLSKFALMSLNLPSLHTIFIAWGTVKGHEHSVQSSVRALWIFGRFIRYIYLKGWMRHIVLSWQKLMVSLLIDIVRVKDFFLLEQSAFISWIGLIYNNH